jgi:hypothetical protein
MRRVYMTVPDSQVLWSVHPPSCRDQSSTVTTQGTNLLPSTYSLLSFSSSQKTVLCFSKADLRNSFVYLPIFLPKVKKKAMLH